MLSLHEIILRLTVAAALGAVIGLERVVRRRPAGVRTSLFVCLATALFTILSNELAHRFGDSSGTRIASNIVQGIGFLGAGAILRGSGAVVGMTTADDLCGGRYRHGRRWRSLRRRRLFDGAGALWLDGYRVGGAILQFEVPAHSVPRHYQPCRECCHGSSAADGEPEDSHATLPRFDGGRELYCGI